MSQASEHKCCKKGCKEQAVAFFPVCDPDIPSYPYCRRCLDKAKISLIIFLHGIDNKFKK